MFPRYMFVRFDTSNDQWRRIASARGVQQILGTTPETPTPVPDAVIAALSQVYKEEVPVSALPNVEIERGALVRLLEGPLKGVEGVCKWSDARRVRFFHDLLGDITAKKTDVEVV